MRIFLDASTIISGILFMGNEHDLLLKGNKATLITSEDVLDETRKTIEQKFPDDMALVEAFLKILRLQIVQRKYYTKKLWDYTQVRDAKDKHVLAAAVASKSDYLVSGDADLLTLKKYRTLQIIHTKDALMLLKS